MTNDNKDSSPTENQATVTKESTPSQSQLSTLTNSTATTTPEAPSKQPTPSITATNTTTDTATTSNNNGTSSTQPLREDMLKSAVSFLSSPNVRSADNAKKVAFLRQKGLTADEITEAFKRVGENGPVTTATAVSTGSAPPRPMTAPISQAGPPPVVNRPAVPPRPPQVVYYQPAPPRIMPIQQLLGIALLAGFGLVGLTAAAVRLVKRFIGPILNSIARYQSDRYNRRSTLLTRLNKTLIDLKPTVVNKQLVEKHKTLSERVGNVVELADKRVRTMNSDESYKDFRDKLTGLKDAITNPHYMNFTYSHFNSFGYSPGRMNNSNDSPAVQSFKSEIRSFKGMLLNRRNFPMASTTQNKSRPASPVTPLSPTRTTTTTTTATTPPSATAAPIRDIPQYHPRRRESYRAELNNNYNNNNSSPSPSISLPSTTISAATTPSQSQ